MNFRLTNENAGIKILLASLGTGHEKSREYESSVERKVRLICIRCYWSV